MKLNFILIFLCLATLSISGCLSLNPGEYKRSINVRISWDELKIFNKNQTNLLMNISNYNFSKQIINQNKTSFKIQCSKKPEIDTTIYFELFEEKNSTIGNITYNGGGMIIKYSFPNDPCYYTDKTCIQTKRNKVEQECNPILVWLNITVNWNILKWSGG